MYKSREVPLCLYKSLVRPCLEYCTAAWLAYYKKDKKLINKIQRRFTHMVPGLAKLPYETRLKRLKLWSLESRRVRADLTELFKMIHGLLVVNFSSTFLI